MSEEKQEFLELDLKKIAKSMLNINFLFIMILIIFILIIYYLWQSEIKACNDMLLNLSNSCLIYS